MKKSNKKYEDPCYFHRCQDYKYAEDLEREIYRIYKEWNSTKERAYPFLKFLRGLNILPSTLDHWKTCKPLNLKLMEGVKLFCEETIFDSISDDKRLVLEYLKITRPKTEPKEEENKKDKLPIDFLTSDEKDKN